MVPAAGQPYGGVGPLAKPVDIAGQTRTYGSILPGTAVPVDKFLVSSQ